MSKSLKALFAACALVAAGTAIADSQVVNLYSARHYSTDEELYNGFTKATGIKINRVDGDDAGIIARLKAEGQASPADVIMLLSAFRWMTSSAAVAVPVGAQIWLREPASDTASVVRWRPAAISRRTGSSAKGSISATPQ